MQWKANLVKSDKIVQLRTVQQFQTGIQLQNFVDALLHPDMLLHGVVDIWITLIGSLTATERTRSSYLERSGFPSFEEATKTLLEWKPVETKAAPKAAPKALTKAYAIKMGKKSKIILLCEAAETLMKTWIVDRTCLTGKKRLNPLRNHIYNLLELSDDQEVSDDMIRAEFRSTKWAETDLVSVIALFREIAEVEW